MVTRRLTPAWEALGYQIMEKDARPDHAAWGQPAEVYDLKDVFTITDGHWAPGETDKPIDIPAWASQDYGDWWAMQGAHYYPPVGSAISLFALVLDQHGNPQAGKQMWFFTPDANRLVAPYGGLENWARQNTGPQGMTHIDIGGHESGYTPPNRGPWAICPLGLADVLYYTGRYQGWHISTMAVWQARANGPVTPPVTPPGGGGGGNVDLTPIVQRLDAIMAWLHMPA